MSGAVVDTVVAHYFLLAERFGLLMELLPDPVLIPRLVFDPDETDPTPETASELRRSVFHEHRAAVQAADEEERNQALLNARNLSAIGGYIEGGLCQIADLTDEELQLYARLVSRAPSAEFSLVIGLGAGEAAAVAMAVARGPVLVTDDSAALRVLESLAAGHPYERVRKLLIRAADEERISREEANRIHRQMREHGFWDRTSPFADE